MVLRPQLRQAMAISEGQTYRLVGSEYHPDQGKMGGVTHARVENVGTGTLGDYCFRSELKLQEVAIERHRLEFLSIEGGHCCLMNPDHLSKPRSPTELSTRVARLLFAGVRLAVEFLDGRPVSVVFPDVLD